MAEKHKSKYKAPKDLEKSQKPKARKDLKDYTTDDKEGKLNPKSNGDTIPNLLRKTDKPVVDDGTYDVKWNADDRLYDDLENGDYDPKKALKKLKKREDKEETDIEDTMKHKTTVLTKESLRDRVKKLTTEQKEALIKEYIRKKIQKSFLSEQEEKKEEPVEEVPAAETPAAEVPMPAPAPIEVPAEPVAKETPAPEETPAEETPESQENEKRVKEAAATEKYIASLQGESNDISRLKSIANVINLSVPAETQADFYRMLRTLAIKKLANLAVASKSNTSK